VQSVKELPSGGALKLTTATYRTPAGRDIANRGVEPDFAGSDDPLTRPDEGVIAAELALFDLLKA
jgi:C-terminal processing protease CtpA/Prc